MGGVGVIWRERAGVGEEEEGGVGRRRMTGDIFTPVGACKELERCKYCCFTVAQVLANLRLTWLTVSVAFVCLCRSWSLTASDFVSLQSAFMFCI